MIFMLLLRLFAQSTNPAFPKRHRLEISNTVSIAPLHGKVIIDDFCRAIRCIYATVFLSPPAFSACRAYFHMEHGAYFARLGADAGASPHLVLRLMFTLEYDERAFREMYWNYGTPPNQQKNFCAHFCANLVDGLFSVFLALGIGLKSFMTCH